MFVRVTGWEGSVALCVVQEFVSGEWHGTGKQVRAPWPSSYPADMVGKTFKAQLDDAGNFGACEVPS